MYSFPIVFLYRSSFQSKPLWLERFPPPHFLIVKMSFPNYNFFTPSFFATQSFLLKALKHANRELKINRVYETTSHRMPWCPGHLHDYTETSISICSAEFCRWVFKWETSLMRVIVRSSGNNTHPNSVSVYRCSSVPHLLRAPLTLRSSQHGYCIWYMLSEPQVQHLSQYNSLKMSRKKKILALFKVLAEIPPILLEAGFHPKCGS